MSDVTYIHATSKIVNVKWVRVIKRRHLQVRCAEDNYCFISVDFVHVFGSSLRLCRTKPCRYFRSNVCSLSIVMLSPKSVLFRLHLNMSFAYL